MSLLSRDDFRFFHRLRVRWAEVDMQKIVFNAHYLMYFDTAITDYWRALALPYESSMAALGGDLYVVKATVEYHASARADEQLDVAMKCSRIGNSSMVFTGAIFRGEQHLITGEIVYVFADPATQRSRPVPEALRAMLTGFEAGEDMLALRVGDWSALGEPARALRTEVFVEEQGIPLDLELDAEDASAVHAVALNRLGRAVATGRLLRGEAPGTGLRRLPARVGGPRTCGYAVAPGTSAPTPRPRYSRSHRGEGTRPWTPARTSPPPARSPRRPTAARTACAPETGGCTCASA